jgi:hypothetical protein
MFIKSIDFTSSKDYFLRAGCFHPASLINLPGQSGLELALRGLRGLPKRSATPAGSFYPPSYSSPPCGLSRRPYDINIQLVVLFVKRILQKNQKKVSFFSKKEGVFSTGNSGQGYFLGASGFEGGCGDGVLGGWVGLVGGTGGDTGRRLPEFGYLSPAAVKGDFSR